MKASFFITSVFLFAISAQAAKQEELVSRFSQVAPGIFRGGQPKGEDGLLFLRGQGIKTIINIQGDPVVSPVVAGETQRSRNATIAKAYSVGFTPDSYFNIPVYATHAPTRADIANIIKITKIMNDPHLQPVFIHCNVGVDRTGFIVAAYRMIYQNCSYAAAYREMKELGHTMTPMFTANFHSLMRKLGRGEDLGQERSNQSCPLPNPETE